MEWRSDFNGWRPLEEVVASGGLRNNNYYGQSQLLAHPYLSGR
jgi:hypothetical protein